MADESTMGLLLRAHAELAAQAHGEEYVFRNVSAMSEYQAARESVAAAIRRLAFAEGHQRAQEAVNAAVKKLG